MGMHLHFDCFSGISGDMVLGALVDVGLPVQELTAALAPLKLKGYELRAKKVMRGSLDTTKVDVLIKNKMQSPFSLSRINSLIKASGVPSQVKDRSLAVFERLAEAEGLAHRVSPRHVQFHEVGVIDSFVDVVGGVLACHLLGATRVTSSAVNLGSGFVSGSHGRLPVPAPAVAALAKGIPVYSAGPTRELTTPTGLALLRTLTTEFGPLPFMRPKRIGYGAGSAKPEGWPNALRVFLADVAQDAPATTEIIYQIETNVDDLQPQAYEIVMDRLFGAGALDVTLTPVIMKRGRPGIVLAVLASPEKAQAIAAVVFRETTTLGVRMAEMVRQVLPRRTEVVRLGGRDVRVKVSELEGGAVKAAPEYVDCKRVAEQTGRPLVEVMTEAMQMYGASAGSGKAKRKIKT